MYAPKCFLGVVAAYREALQGFGHHIGDLAFRQRRDFGAPFLPVIAFGTVWALNGNGPGELAER